MAKTTIEWSVQQIVEDGSSSGNGQGHRLLVTITAAYLIDTNVFVFQRGPLTPGSTDYEDVFYSLASVNDMADLASGAPAGDSTFYRSGSVDLFFPNLDELLEAKIDIVGAIECLARANDIANSLSVAQIGYYPEGTYDRYWGFSGLTSLTDGQLLALSHEPGTVKATSKAINTLGDTVYLYLAYRAVLGTGVFTLNAVTEAMTLVSRSVVNANGYTASYNIYRTTATHNGSNLVLAVA
jgi:hypothetical protein